MTPLPEEPPPSRPTLTTDRYDGPVRRRERRWWAAALLLASVSMMLSLWGVGDEPRLEYYAAVVRSMSVSWRNFLFGAFDPAGTISVDKIPGSFWFMALSARFFGFSTWSMVLPNALATGGTVVAVAVIGRRWLGDVVGLASAAAFMFTPIVVAVARSNQPYVIFVFLLVLAAERTSAAIVDGSRRPLIGAGAAVAAAFHCYMMEAWAILPAIAAGCMVGRSGTWRRRWIDLGVVGAIALAGSLVWVTFVASVPADARPWVGGTASDSPWEMVFIYNGVGRIAASPALERWGLLPTSEAPVRSFAPRFGGPPAIDRLVGEAVGGQIAWLFPAAFIGLVVALASRRRSRAADGIGSMIGVWLVTFAAMFSFARGIHQFYVAALAPPVVLLATAGLVSGMRSELRRRRLVVGTILVTTLAMAVLISRRVPGYVSWALATQVVIAVVVITLVSRAQMRMTAPPWVVGALSAAAISLTPAVWAIEAMGNPEAINPVAGPPTESQTTAGEADLKTTDLIAYLRDHRGNARFLLAAIGAERAAPIIAATGEWVLPIGGFGGRDPYPSEGELAALIAEGELTFVLGPLGDPMRLLPDGNLSRLQAWLGEHCEVVEGAPADELRRCAV